MEASICYKTHFNAAFRHYNPHWSKEKNLEIFGSSSLERPNFQGHNYNLEVFLKGAVDETSGNVYDRQRLAQMVKREIEERYDHKNLYEDVEDFKHTVPTPEMMAFRIWQILREQVDQDLELKVVVHQDHKHSAIYEGQ